MSAKTMHSLPNENRDLRKQIGCMNGIFQIFDRHHFLTGRRISSRNNKRLLQGSQQQLEEACATKSVRVKDVEVQRETESCGASVSSSSCSSTFSSLDTETLSLRQINIPDGQLQSREHHPSLSIKSLSHDERRGTVMKHIDSPRPPQQSRIGKVQDERLTLARFSCDGREITKSSMKHKELPRLSLDSKTGTTKASFLEARQVVPLNLEPETHRPSSVVAKLMGLDTFPDTPTIKACPPEQNQVNYSPKLQRFPVQQDSSQGSANNRNLHQTCSVYGEIDKRITELEFNKSGKDLRALKQILEAMQKTRERLAEPTRRVPSCTPKQSGTVVIMKPAKPSMETSHLQRRTQKYKGTNDLTPENKYRNCHLLTTDKKNTKSEYCTTPGRSSGAVSPRLQRGHLRIEGQSHSTTLSSDSGRVKKQCAKKNTEKGSPNRKVKVKAKDQQLSHDQLSELSSDTRYSSYQGDTASVKSESNNSLISQTETEIISMARSINTPARHKQNSASTATKHIAAVESAINMLEQPSPISVLDDAFYCEDSPSPVKKISTLFQDESPSPDEAEWHLETLNHLTDCTRSSHCLEYNHKLGNMENSGHELTLLRNEPDTPAANYDCNLTPDHRYINKILLTSGLLKDSSFFSATDQSVFSHHLINPDMFDVLEQTEEIREAINGGVAEKNIKMKLNNRIQRKIVFDMVDEILVHKITSGGLFTAGRKGTSPQGLLKEVYLEMDRVCRIPDCNLDEEDEMIRLLTADMLHQSEDWVRYSGEVPALVLDIERLIFKDLINELITGEVKDHQDLSKRHCRKLFSI